MEVVFDNVSYTYQENLPIAYQALKDISCRIVKKEINSIIGPSGSGKTTLVELITALMLPTNGCVNVGKFILEKEFKIKDINNLRFNIGFVFQFPEQQFFKETVRKELEFGMTYFKYKLDNVDARVFQALKMVGLDETYLDKNPFSLSSGEKRMIAIASMLVFNPKIIILDEPTVGLDNKSKNLLIRLIKNLKYKHNKTIIIVSHDVDMVYKCSDNVIVLKDGSILDIGNKFEVFKRVDFLKENNIAIPKVVEFSNIVYKKKGIDLGNYTEIKDLIKAIYRNV
jgi:energy-coupling factor transport system ATP-binding protein